MKVEISRLIGGEVLPGEVDDVFAGLHHDTIVSQIITNPKGNSISWVMVI